MPPLIVTGRAPVVVVGDAPGGAPGGAVLTALGAPVGVAMMVAGGGATGGAAIGGAATGGAATGDWATGGGCGGGGVSIGGGGCVSICWGGGGGGGGAPPLSTGTSAYPLVVHIFVDHKRDDHDASHRSLSVVVEMMMMSTKTSVTYLHTSIYLATTRFKFFLQQAAV